MRWSRTLATAFIASTPFAQTATKRPEADRSDALTSPALKGQEVIAFIGVKPGDRLAEIVAAGFKFNGASPAFVNPADPHDKNVFDPSIRGHTDQFMYRFRKPR